MLNKYLLHQRKILPSPASYYTPRLPRILEKSFKNKRGGAITPALGLLLNLPCSLVLGPVLRDPVFARFPGVLVCSALVRLVVSPHPAGTG